MKRARVIGLLWAIAGAGAAGRVCRRAGTRRNPRQPGVTMPEVHGAGTVWPTAAAMTPAPGMVSVRDFRTTITPNAMLAGVNRQYYANTVQPDLTVTPNFSALEAQAVYLDSLNLLLWPSFAIYQNTIASACPGWRADGDVYGLRSNAYRAGLRLTDFPRLVCRFRANAARDLRQ